MPTPETLPNLEFIYQDKNLYGVALLEGREIKKQVKPLYFGAKLVEVLGAFAPDPTPLNVLGELGFDINQPKQLTYGANNRLRELGHGPLITVEEDSITLHARVVNPVRLICPLPPDYYKPITKNLPPLREATRYAQFLQAVVELDQSGLPITNAGLVDIIYGDQSNINPNSSRGVVGRNLRNLMKQGFVQRGVGHERFQYKVTKDIKPLLEESTKN